MNLTQQQTGTPTSPSSQDGSTTADTQCKNSKPTKADSTKGSGLQSVCGLKQPKQKKCKACRNEFVPTRPMQKVCCGDCAISLGNLKKAKRERTPGQKAGPSHAGINRCGGWCAEPCGCACGCGRTTEGVNRGEVVQVPDLTTNLEKQCG